MPRCIGNRFVNRIFTLKSFIRGRSAGLGGACARLSMMSIRSRVRSALVSAALTMAFILAPAIFLNHGQAFAADADSLKPKTGTGPQPPISAPAEPTPVPAPAATPATGGESGGITPPVSKSDTIFMRSALKDGKLESIDKKGREWVYDTDLGMFRLRWVEAQSTRSVRSEVVYFNEDDTVIVGRDRSDNWARDKKKVRTRNKNDVHVRETEFVLGNIRCQGSVEVDGLVEGTVIAVDEIIVSATGIINGDARAPRIRVRRGGLITGREKNTSLFGTGPESDDDNRELVDFSVFPIAGGIGLMLILVGFVSLSVAPKAVSLASDAISRYPLRTIGVGLLSVILAGPVIGLVAVTIILIPLAVIMAIGFPIAILVGVISFSQYIGGISAEAYGVSGWSNIKRIAVGILLMVTLLGAGITLENSSSDFLSGWGVVLIVVGMVFFNAAILSGFGGVVLTRFGRREYVPAIAQSGSPGFPPPPSPPPIPLSPDPSQPAAPTPPEPPDLPQPPPSPDRSENSR